MTTLKPVDRSNWLACSQLSLREDQEGLVASNLKTIAQSKFEPHYQLRAICDGDLPVGMLTYCHEDDPEDLELYWIFRLMIDQRYQGQGFGFAAMQLAIAEIRDKGAKRILTMNKPHNAVAAALYEKLGFEATGEVLDDGDILRELSLR